METEEKKTNGAERPAGFVPPPETKPKFDSKNFDESVLKTIENGYYFTRTIAARLGVHDLRVVDNALRRLKSAGRVYFTGAKSTQGWRLVAVIRTPRAKSKKRAIRTASKEQKARKANNKKHSRRAAKRVKEATRGGKRSNVHCFLPTPLVRHVKRQLKPGETFTDAVQNGLTKKYGSP